MAFDTSALMVVSRRQNAHEDPRYVKTRCALYQRRQAQSPSHRRVNVEWRTAERVKLETERVSI
ncbi:MAG: hypothetical protein ABF990_03450 [Acetobacter sp.]|uniref:hypothetical protein n=1 Tax=Acetobacter sp. TaxID=440 RepID=UPI0039ED8C55